MICCAFSLNRDENSHIVEILSNPFVERRKELKTVRGGGNVNCHFAAILRGSLKECMKILRIYQYQTLKSHGSIQMIIYQSECSDFMDLSY